MPIINQIVKGSGGSAPAHYIEKTVDANGQLVGGNTFIDLTNTNKIGNYQLAYAYYGNANLTSIDFLDVTELGDSALAYCFYNCTGIIGNIVVEKITTASTVAFGYAFYGCTGISSVVFKALNLIAAATIFNRCFQSCTNLTSLSFPALNSTSFGSITNQFNNMLMGVTGCTVHFPSNLQSVIGSWASVTSGFGGTNTTVLFDLPATYTLTGADSVTYTRNPKYDTATALAWKVGAYGTTNFTPAYYTSGTTDPVVSDTIYSDAACTTAVTTISAIA